MHAADQARAPQAKKSPRPAAKAPAGGGGILGLQSSAGNAAVVQMLRQAGHRWAQPEQHQHGAGCGHQQVQRSAVHDVLRSGGRPLDDTTRTDMEARLGADFSDVRVHNDSAAKASAAEVGARAYTSGNHVVIGDGGADKHTLAHELTHVIQQRRGPVAGTDNGAGLSVSDPSDRFEREAEANATRVMAQSPTPLTAQSAAPSRGGAEPTSAGVAVQRMFQQPALTPQQQYRQQMEQMAQDQLDAQTQHMALRNQQAAQNITNNAAAYPGRVAIPGADTLGIHDYNEGNGPGSPRAELRRLGIQENGGGSNHFNIDGHANYSATKTMGVDRNGVSISRNHRLSDHYIAHILNEVLQRYDANNAGHSTAVLDFIRACVPGRSVNNVVDRFFAFAVGQGPAGNAQQAPGEFQGLVSDASNNPRNLRFGASGVNSGIGKLFDAAYFSDANGGEMTPISESLHLAVWGLVDAGLLALATAEASLDVRLGKDTSSDLL